jgi:hypothetical protein
MVALRRPMRLADRRQPYRHERRDRADGGHARRAGHRDLHLHRPPEPAAEPHPLQAHAGRRRTFDFDVSGPTDATQTLQTKTEGAPVNGAPLKLDPGRYEVTESPPHNNGAGKWERVSVNCNGKTFADPTNVSGTVTAGRGVACLFTNRFVPAGALTLRKLAIGNTGTAGFLISSTAKGAASAYTQSAVVSHAGDTVLATGDSTAHLRLGTYRITETRTAKVTGGRWTMAYVLCNGQLVGGAQGRITVTLTASTPKLDCTFVNRFTRTGTPTTGAPAPAPPPPLGAPTTPTPAGPHPAPAAQLGVEALSLASGPFADLEVTKRVSPTVAQPGQQVHYTGVVENHGPATATDVAVAELRRPHSRRLVLHITRGSCVGDRPALSDRHSCLRPTRRDHGRRARAPWAHRQLRRGVILDERPGPVEQPGPRHAHRPPGPQSSVHRLATRTQALTHHPPGRDGRRVQRARTRGMAVGRSVRLCPTACPTGPEFPRPKPNMARADLSR